MENIEEQDHKQGDLERSHAAQVRLAPLRVAFGLGTFPVVVKEAMNIIGLSVGPARQPISYLEKEKKDELRKVLTEIGAL